ncbi:MAG: hypothetical protein JW913_04570, partial [Chitinispirillaceae bacterium]|nr:hypothetical protein [Chitinispirillaceae bacterium]
SSVYLWIQRCPSCGYCAPEIVQGDEADREIVRGEVYLTQLKNSSFPETANAFLCYSLIMRNRKLFADAAWAAVFASWICDDNGYSESAYQCRGSAIDLFEAARRNQQDFADSKDQEEIYLIDFHRRRSQFDIAAKLCNEALEKEHPDQFLDILYFERELIDNRDSAAHSDREADNMNG